MSVTNEVWLHAVYTHIYTYTRLQLDSGVLNCILVYRNEFQTDFQCKTVQISIEFQTVDISIEFMH